MEIFWETIALYNYSTWVYQIALIFIGLVLTVILIFKPREWVKLAMKIYLIVLCLWIAVVYYHIYCSERKFNNILTVFWTIMACVWIWDAIKGYTTFSRSYKYDYLAYLLLLMPFLYPLISILRGLTFPEITTPIMPCSVAVFSIGILLLFSKKINMVIVLFLCHWSILAISKTYFFNIPEDFLLASASVPALYLFFKEYFARDLHKETKPKAKYINFLLVFMSVIIGVLLTATFFVGLKY
ncbi:MAG: putative rane protein [Bacteroidetes bacterium]|nr:putative rane protein [Bacteroidota bacterium]